MTIKIFLFASLLFGSFHLGKSGKKDVSEDSREFIYVLKYTSEFKQAIKWTTKENEIAKEHLAYVKELIDEGKAYMLGRTTNIYDPELFGIVIFDAPNMEEAKKIMQNDPLIKNNIMTGTLHLFSIVFIKNKGA